MAIWRLPGGNNVRSSSRNGARWIGTSIHLAIRTLAPPTRYPRPCTTRLVGGAGVRLYMAVHGHMAVHWTTWPYMATWPYTGPHGRTWPSGTWPSGTWPHMAVRYMAAHGRTVLRAVHGRTVLRAGTGRRPPDSLPGSVVLGTEACGLHTDTRGRGWYGQAMPARGEGRCTQGPTYLYGPI